jgi:hypothetical protein
MTEITHLRPKLVTSFPTSMEHGVIYVSVEYNSCGHLCACGCGREVITPLSPAQWTITYDGENISLRPSIGSWSLPCRSHYFVERGRVRWARDFTVHEIARNRLRDRTLLEGRHSDDEPLLDEPHQELDLPMTRLKKDARRDGVLKRMTKRLRNFVR